MKRAWMWMALLAVLGAACARSEASAVEARLIPLAGEILVGDGQVLKPVTKESDLREEVLVRTGEDGRALLELAGDRTLEMAPDTEVRLDDGGDRPTLVTGSALATGERGLAVGVDRSVEVQSTGGVYRLDQDAGSLRVGVYQGSVLIPGSGWSGTLLPLHQAVVTSSSVPEPPRPLQVDPRDAWDVRMIGEAIDVGLGLETLQRGLRSQLADRGAHRLVAGVLPEDLPRGRAMPILRKADPAESVVAAVVASRAAADTEDSPLSLLSKVLDLRGDGASWIVVVAQWELAQARLLQALGRVATDIARLILPAVTGSDGGSASPSTGGSSSPSASPSGGGGGGGGGGSDGDQSNNDDPPPPPPPPPPPQCGDNGETQAECLVNDVLGGDGLGLG
jgi:hypothetical protein